MNKLTLLLHNFPCTSSITVFSSYNIWPFAHFRSSPANRNAMDDQRFRLASSTWTSKYTGNKYFIFMKIFIGVNQTEADFRACTQVGTLLRPAFVHDAHQIQCQCHIAMLIYKLSEHSSKGKLKGTLSLTKTPALLSPTMSHILPRKYHFGFSQRKCHRETL